MFDKLKQLGELKKMRDQAMQIQKQLAQETIEVEENGIKIMMTADQKIQEIEIEGERQDKLIDVINKAVKRSQEVAARKLQEMGGGLGGLLG
ncbi:MAG: YbaB/EbfC family nucleoid-associated protein [bacterium]|nr:YbaB/EbfC family nucleoid-associated protein [bacterium]